MVSFRRAGSLAVLVALFGAESGRAEPPAPPFADGFPVTQQSSIYELEEVARGDRGIGYTVFAGDEVEPFQVEVLGIMEDMLGPDRPVILARLSGAKIEFTGVISGMSGSPVYIDGRLVGAVAYRFGSFAREPIAGITPIRSMLAARGGPSVARPVRRVSAEGISVDAIHGQDASWLDMPLPGSVGGADGSEEVANRARPITTPVSASGIAPAAREVLARRLRSTSGSIASFAAGHAPIRRASENAPGRVGGVTALPIAPASPIAALLVKGDLNIAAIGTVTYVEDGEVLAFGHPFVGFGRVAFPMATAGILNTLASEAGSYKQGIAAREVGVIRDDRLTAISGALGETADTVPFVVNFTDATGHTETTRVDIVSDPFWLPIMLEAVASSALEGRLDLEVGGTVDATMRIALDDRALQLTQSHSAPSPVRVTSAVGFDLGTIAAVIARNDLAEPTFERVELTARYRTEVQLAEVVRVVPDATLVEAGDTVGLSVLLRDFRGRVTSERLELRVPRSARGALDVHVAGGPSFDQTVERKTGRSRPTTFDALLGLIADRRPADQLVAGAFVDADALTVGTRKYPAPPTSWRLLIERSAPEPVSRGSASLVAESSRQVDAVIRGSASTQLMVRAARDNP